MDMGENKEPWWEIQNSLDFDCQISSDQTKASSGNEAHREKKLEHSSLNVNQKPKLESKEAKADEPFIFQESNFSEMSAKILSRHSSLVETSHDRRVSRSKIDKKQKKKKPLVDLKQLSTCEIPVDSRRNNGMEQLPLYSVGDNKFKSLHSHPRTQYFLHTVPVYDHRKLNPNIIAATNNWTTNPEQNQICSHTGKYFEQRFMDPSSACAKNGNISSQYSTVHSTSSKNNTDCTQLSLPIYTPLYAHQLQVPAPVNMPIACPVIPISHRIPTTPQNLFPPYWTKGNTNQHAQPPRAIPNLLGIIKPPSTIVQNRFNLTPEIPEQIFTLPMLRFENSGINIFQEQNIAISIQKKSKKLSKFEEFAKRSDHSKKNVLSVEIPVELPTKSLFPSYSTPPGGHILRPLQQPPIQFPTPSSCVYFGSPFASVPGIISNEPNDQRRLSAQPIADSYSSPVNFNQALTQPATQNMFQNASHLSNPLHPAIPSGSHTGNPMQPKIQAEISIPFMGQFQPVSQTMGAEYRNPNTFVRQPETGFSTDMQLLTTCRQYQGFSAHVNQYRNEYQPVAPNLTAISRYQNPLPPMYHIGA